ncbi:MAG TPA: TetR/AcrR family transcriptional regulator [Candidatus Cloacimonetes bacterium]|nr:TetR/AcrR family transcriptional regulator [Candidatus Cloacimonadota bacterium]
MEMTKRQMEIMQAAIGLIAREGYENLTTKNIAAELGVSDAALYRHFDSKKELIVMILRYFEDISCRVISTIDSKDLSPMEKIRYFVMNRYEMFREDPELAMVMFSEELFKNDHTFEEYLLSIMHIHRDQIMGYIMQGQKLGEIRSDLNPMNIFRMIVGSMRMLVTQWNLSKHAFDLELEGKSLFNTIKKLIEVKR